MNKPEIYKPKNKIRIVTAASLFDGHDAAINIMRRIIQSTGCEVIHLGHDRSVEEVVNTAIQEDAQAIAMTSYQGGHNEYFKYMYDLLKEKGAAHIKIFAGGGGVILPEEIKELMDYGITRIYSPDDGRAMGLQGMINDLVRQSDYPLGDQLTNEIDQLATKNPMAIGRLISAAENYYEQSKGIFDRIKMLAEKSADKMYDSAASSCRDRCERTDRKAGRAQRASQEPSGFDCDVLKAEARQGLSLDRFLLRLLGGLHPGAARQPARDLAIAGAFFIHFRDRPAARMPLLADEHPVVGGRWRLVGLCSQPSRTRALRKSI